MTPRLVKSMVLLAVVKLSGTVYNMNGHHHLAERGGQVPRKILSPDGT